MPFDPDKYVASQTAPPRAEVAPRVRPFDPDEYVKQSESGFEKSWEQSAADGIRSVGNFLLKPVVAVGRKIDSVSGAPTRAAIGAVQAGESPLKAFAKQFGEDPETAPTGKEIAAKMGISTEEYRVPIMVADQGGFRRAKVSLAEGAGLAIDTLADPLNIVGPTALAKIGGKAAIGSSKVAMAGIKGGAGAVDVITGTEAASKLVGAAGETAKATKLALTKLFNPKRADDYADLARIAERNGVPVADLPEAVEFGHDSVITRASRVHREGPHGEADLEKFRSVTEKTKRATEAKVASIAGGRILRPEEAGQLIREGYDQAVDRLMRSSSDTYRTISAANPGLLLNADEAAKLGGKLDELGKFAESRVKMGMTKAQKGQAKQLQDAVESMRASMAEAPAVGRPLFDDTVQRLQILGEAAFKKQNGLDLDPPDLKRLRTLYGDMRESIVGTVEKDLSAELATKLRENNARISKFLDERSPLESTLGAKNIADEKVYERLVANGDTAKLEALREVLTPEQFQQLKGSFLDGVIYKDIDGNFGFRSTINRMRGNQTLMEAMLSPEELKEFADLVRLGDRFGTPIMSTSGTGASGIFKDIGQGVKNSLANESFIKTLKNRARGEPPKPAGAKTIPTPYGDMELMPDNANRFQSAAKGVLKRSGIDVRLKGSQVLSTQPLDENEKRREAIRRRLEKGEK